MEERERERVKEGERKEDGSLVARSVEKYFPYRE